MELQQIEEAIARLKKRLADLKDLETLAFDDPRVCKAESSLERAVRKIFGVDSPEEQAFRNFMITFGAMVNMEDHELQEQFVGDLPRAIARVEALIESLEEDRDQEQSSSTELAMTEKSEIDIFISHSSNNAEVAELLADLLRTAFLTDKIRCTSVAGYRLPTGADTDETLLQELRTAAVCIGILTEISMGSAYVLFELGARWALGKHLAPVLAAGASHGILVGPISGKHVSELTSRPDVEQLLREVGEALGKTYKMEACSKAIEILVARNVELSEEAGRAQEAQAEFVEKRGVLWKREADGTIAEDPYCPNCKTALSNLSGNMPCTCTVCRFCTPFKHREIPAIRAQVS